MAVLQFEHALSILFVIFPFPAVLPLLRFEYPVAFLFVSHPIAVIVYIFEVVVLSQTLLFSVHPLPIVDFLLLALTSAGFSQEHSRAVLPVPFELTAILQVLFAEIVDPVAFDPFAPPCADVDISVGKSVLPLDQLPSLVIDIFGICGLNELRRSNGYIFCGVILIVLCAFIVYHFSSFAAYSHFFILLHSRRAAAFIVSVRFLPTDIVLEGRVPPRAFRCRFPRSIIF